MKERDLITAFMGDMTTYCGAVGIPFWYEKYSDVPVSWMGNSKFAGKKRFVDTFGGLKDKPFAIEWKLHKSLSGFPFDKVTDEQMECLECAASTGWLAFVAIGQVLPINGYSEKQLTDAGVEPSHVNRKRLYRLWLFDWSEWKAIESLSDKKSIRLNECNEVCRPLSKVLIGNKAHWDIAAALDEIYPIQKETA